jgi:hypothetical protein
MNYPINCPICFNPNKISNDYGSITVTCEKCLLGDFKIIRFYLYGDESSIKRFWIIIPLDNHYIDFDFDFDYMNSMIRLNTYNVKRELTSQEINISDYKLQINPCDDSLNLSSELKIEIKRLLSLKAFM